MSIINKMKSAVGSISGSMSEMASNLSNQLSSKDEIEKNLNEISVLTVDLLQVSRMITSSEPKLAFECARIVRETTVATNKIREHLHIQSNVSPSVGSGAVVDDSRTTWDVT